MSLNSVTTQCVLHSSPKEVEQFSVFHLSPGDPQKVSEAVCVILFCPGVSQAWKCVLAQCFPPRECDSSVCVICLLVCPNPLCVTTYSAPGVYTP